MKKKIIIISIHALLAESDALGAVTSPAVIKFLSTLSLRRATFYNATSNPVNKLFLSTLSLRRATTGCQAKRKTRLISIHALLAESDPLYTAE